MQFDTLKWIGDTGGLLELLDQRLLPGRVETLQCTRIDQLFEAIQTLAVRGAPAIGVAAAYGVCIGIQQVASEASRTEGLQAVHAACDYLAKSRPTAVNLFWALERMRKTADNDARQHPDAGVEAFKQRLLDEAHAICSEDKAMCQAIGEAGQVLIPEGGAVLTHCNAGALATAGIGTALAPMYVAHESGRHFKVYVDETRPLLQGARLTAWELAQAGIAMDLICDNMPASLMQGHSIDAVITGADRIAANGDAANKIGTLGLSILARHYGIPFYIAAPSSTFDLSLATGADIPIEQRRGDEVTACFGTRLAPDGVSVYNPAFDVTPAAHITAIITEKGVIDRPDRHKIAALLGTS